jgi:phytoene dehydrogenase-like protein
MADVAYDAVIVGGGNKAVLLAMYLQKYGGMNVGVFERRHEIGGLAIYSVKHDPT